MTKLKTIFFGTPELSIPYLDLLNQLTDVQLVVTQADKPRGRGMTITPCPVKQHALALGLILDSIKKVEKPKILDIGSGSGSVTYCFGLMV